MGCRVTWLQVAVTFNVCNKMSFLFRDWCPFCSHILSICCAGQWGQYLCNPWCLVASAQLFHMQNFTTWKILWNQLLSVIFDKEIRHTFTILSGKPFKMQQLRRINRWIGYLMQDIKELSWEDRNYWTISVSYPIVWLFPLYLQVPLPGSSFYCPSTKLHQHTWYLQWATRS